MKIGPYELFPIETGRFALDGGAMFGIIPRPLWQGSNPPDERNRIDLAARALLLVGDGKKILIDNGNGSKFTDKQVDIYRLDMSTFALDRSLAHAGVTPDQITDVILTHLHFDHAGGSTFWENGKLRPSFPNATYYVQKEHFALSQKPSDKDKGSFMYDDFMPLVDEGILKFVKGEVELFPNIRMVVTNGHTTAQQLPKISDGTTTLLYCCDLIPTRAHIPLPYIMAYDVRPLQTLEDKKKLLARALEEDWILFYEHDPYTAAGKIIRTDKGFKSGASVIM